MKSLGLDDEDFSPINLRDLKVERLGEDQQERFDELLGQEHYLGKSPPVGHMLRQIVTYEGRWVALLLWGPCSYHLKPRDEWIGWDKHKAKQRRNLIVQNRRFLVLGETRKPNLASRALALAVKVLPQHWQQLHGYQPALAETFTDPEQFHGTCYKAAGWIALGFSQGYKRHRSEYYIDENHPKKLWVKPLHAQGKYWLYGPDEHIARACRPGLIEDSPDRSLALKAEQIRSLRLCLVRNLEDPRKNNRVFSLGSLLTLVSMGILCGYYQLSDIQRLGTLLTQQQRAWVGLPIRKGKSRRAAPSYHTFYNLLKQIDAQKLSEVLNSWCQAHWGSLPKSLALDGKNIRNRVHQVTLAEHQGGSPVAMTITEDKGQELPAAQQLLKSSNLENTVVTADALHCQKKRQK